MGENARDNRLKQERNDRLTALPALPQRGAIILDKLKNKFFPRGALRINRIFTTIKPKNIPKNTFSEIDLAIPPCFSTVGVPNENLGLVQVRDLHLISAIPFGAIKRFICSNQHLFVIETAAQFNGTC